MARGEPPTYENGTKYREPTTVANRMYPFNEIGRRDEEDDPDEVETHASAAEV
jgi:hypothetical protein